MIAILGTGYLGLSLRETLRERGWSVTTFGREIMSTEPETLGNAEVVIHAIGPSGERATLADLEGAVRAHVGMAARIAAWLKEDTGRRAIYLSSASVYSGRCPFTETDASIPRTVYGSLKRAGEIALENQPNATILRLAHVYGVGARRDPNGIVNKMLATAQRGEWGQIRGGPNRYWDYLHTSDLAGAIVRVLSHRAPPRLVNLGMGGIRMTELEAAICKATSCEPFFEYDYDVTAPHMRLDANVARSALGWFPRVSLNDGIAELAAA